MNDHIELSGEQFSQLHEALVGAFNDASFNLFLAIRLGNRPAADIPGPGQPLSHRVFELIGWFQQRGIERRLIIAAIA